MKNLLPVFIFLLLLSACQKPSCPGPVQISDPPEEPDEEAKTINSWALKTSNISGSLIAIDFPTSTTGYISGTNGTLFKTTNGGVSYQDISPLAGYDYYALDFVSENVGYVVNNNSSADGNVYKTTDGGQNFEEQLDLPPHVWRCIQFLDEDFGFVGGGILYNTPETAGKLYKTVNGGDNWEEITNISDLKTVRDIFFVNSSVIYISTDYARVYKSTDGGNNWSLTNHTILNFSYANKYLVPSVLHFKNADEGFCLTNGAGAVGLGTFLKKTTNGGLNWTEITLPASGYSTYNYYVSSQFADANTGYLCGGNLAEGKGSILKTINGGDTWTPMAIDIPRLQGMSLVNDTLAYIVGANSTVLKSVP